VRSVASFFVSRVDTETDKRLEAIGSDEALALRGKLAIANAKIAYENYLKAFSGPRWEALEAKGALPQRCLWASTSTKNPEYRDVLYVEELIGPHTVNTMPEETIQAFQDHGEVRGDTVEADLEEAHALLQEKLPAVPVDLSVELQTGKTAEDVAGNLVKLVEAKRPTLVIWQTGTVDAMRSLDPDDFRGAVGEGVAALQKAGVDVVLINLQYSPRTETMISAPPYLDSIRVVAQQHDVPLFDRFAIMRHWNDAGDFDLFSTTHGPELAKRVHGCLGRALTKFVIDAAHLSPSQQN